MNQDQNRFFDEIADDFFAECDEILSLIRKNLLKLDELKVTSRPAKSILEEMLRSFHTLKGLTGMIGAENIMRLTHAIESYLKAIYEGRSEMNPDALNTIFSSVVVIEQQLDALRNKSESPDISDILGKLEGLHPSVNKIGEPANDAPEQEVTAKNVKKWKFLFTPSRELYEKGININVVRDRITSLGEVTGSRPGVLEDGGITFEFTVLTDKPESFFSAWRADGIEYMAYPEDNDIKNEKSTPAERTTIQKNVVRVELGKLDEIMTTVGDLVISRARLNDYLTSFKSAAYNASELHEINVQFDRQLRDLREGIMKLRLVPVSEAFERLRFVVRDLIRESGKSIRLETAGEDTQIDKFVMEKIFDSLLHIVRNAVSHGIEPPEHRAFSGKPLEAKLLLRASASGDSVLFEIEDDGSGIDRKKIREKAIEEGIIESEHRDDDETMIEIMTTPGFTTKEQTDMVSGRGVGMNIARKTIGELGGTLNFSSERGKGTKFIIRLPLTLSIVNALIVKAGDSVFAVPLPVINEVVRFNSDEIIRMENNEMFTNRDVILPVLRLREFFNLGIAEREYYHALVVGLGNDKVAIAVDRIIGQREIVVRSLPDPMVMVDGISGVTELGEGKIVLIIDVNSLVRSAIRNKQKTLTKNEYERE